MFFCNYSVIEDLYIYVMLWYFFFCFFFCLGVWIKIVIMNDMIYNILIIMNVGLNLFRSVLIKEFVSVLNLNFWYIIL